MDVITTIQRIIRKAPERMIPFRIYMEHALYSPEGGYYQQEKPKVGKQGDFYTNASVGSVYGEVIADVLWEMLGKLPGHNSKTIVEMGGGAGQLSAHILRYLQETGRLADMPEPLPYIMIETSAYHRSLQQEALSAFGEAVDVRWYESIKEAKAEWGELHGVFFSNELPDAFPVHLIEYRDGSWHEVYVTEEEEEEEGRLFSERLGPLSTPMLADYIKDECIPPLEGYRTEVNLESLRWMEDVAGWLTRGYILTVDYGYERGVLYAPSRKNGTLLCYRSHTISEDPYKAPGESDITSHVNFSALIDKGEVCGLKTLGFYTQQQFLMQAGIVARLQSHTGGDPFRNEAAKRNRAIRQLIVPEGMGHAFRVLIQAKGVESTLTCCTPWSLQM